MVACDHNGGPGCLNQPVGAGARNLKRCRRRKKVEIFESLYGAVTLLYDSRLHYGRQTYTHG